jgi:hypothetical protein
MIFSAPLYGRVLAGRKTQHRRPVLRNDAATKHRPGMRHCVKRRQDTPAEAHIVLTDVRREPVGEITFEDARAEGFKTRAEFAYYWLNLHDRQWAKWNQERLERGEELLSDFDALERFNGQHFNRQVWVLTFELDHSDRPRLLADRNARTDYTEQPARSLRGSADAGEAIDAATAERYAREGHQGFLARAHQREMDRELLAAEERLRLARIEARVRGIDVAHLEASIVDRIRRLERKVHKRAA